MRLWVALLVGIAVGPVGLSPARAELDILAVVQTRDYAVAIDTVRFVWEVLPDQVFYPDSFGGQPRTTDSAVFTIPILWFPPAVRIHYRSGGNPTRCETIPVLVQDSWYLLRSGSGDEPLIKFLRLPGVAEEQGCQTAALAAWPNPFREGVWFSGVSGCLKILDSSGRVVCRLAPAQPDQPDSRYWDGGDAEGQPVPPGRYLLLVGQMPAMVLVKFRAPCFR